MVSKPNNPDTTNSNNELKSSLKSTTKNSKSKKVIINTDKNVTNTLDDVKFDEKVDDTILNNTDMKSNNKEKSKNDSKDAVKSDTTQNLPQPTVNSKQKSLPELKDTKQSISNVSNGPNTVESVKQPKVAATLPAINDNTGKDGKESTNNAKIKNTKVDEKKSDLKSTNVTTQPTSIPVDSKVSLDGKELKSSQPTDVTKGAGKIKDTTIVTGTNSVSDTSKLKKGPTLGANTVKSELSQSKNPPSTLDNTKLTTTDQNQPQTTLDSKSKSNTSPTTTNKPPSKPVDSNSKNNVADKPKVEPKTSTDVNAKLTKPMDNQLPVKPAITTDTELKSNSSTEQKESLAKAGPAVEAKAKVVVEDKNKRTKKKEQEVTLPSTPSQILVDSKSNAVETTNNGKPLPSEEDKNKSTINQKDIPVIQTNKKAVPAADSKSKPATIVEEKDKPASVSTLKSPPSTIKPVPKANTTITNFDDKKAPVVPSKPTVDPKVEESKNTINQNLTPIPPISHPKTGSKLKSEQKDSTSTIPLKTMPSNVSANEPTKKQHATGQTKPGKQKEKASHTTPGSSHSTRSRAASASSATSKEKSRPSSSKVSGEHTRTKAKNSELISKSVHKQSDKITKTPLPPVTTTPKQSKRVKSTPNTPNAMPKVTEKSKVERSRTKSNPPKPVTKISNAHVARQRSTSDVLHNRLQTNHHDNEKIEPRKKPPMASLSPYREQGRANLQKLQKLNQISRIPVLSNTKKINRTTKFKKIHAAVQHLVDLQTMQNLERFSRKKSIPSIEIKRDTDLVVELPELDWKNEQVVKSTVEKLQLKSLELQKDNSEYQQQILVLQRRISKEQEKGKGFIIPKVTTTVPTSLEANIHLRFQYQKNLENERKKYTGLVLENERLLLTIKELSMKNYKNKKALSIEEQTQHSNEVSLLKAKIRELILDNQQLTEIVVKREQTIEKLAKEKEYIYGEMMTMRRLQMHLSNRLENDDSSNIPTMTPAIAEPINSESAESNSNQEKKVIPHYAETLKRNTEVKLRDNNARQISIQEQTLSKKKKIDPATKARLYEPKKPNKKSQEPNSVKQQEKLDTVPRIMPERNIQSASHQRAKTISTDSITDKPSGDTNRTRSTSEQAAMNAAKIKMEYDAYVQPKKLES